MWNPCGYRSEAHFSKTKEFIRTVAYWNLNQIGLQNERKKCKKGNSNSLFVPFFKFRFQVPYSLSSIYHLSLIEHDVKRVPKGGMGKNCLYCVDWSRGRWSILVEITQQYSTSFIPWLFPSDCAVGTLSKTGFQLSGKLNVTFSKDDKDMEKALCYLQRVVGLVW